MAFSRALALLLCCISSAGFCAEAPSEAEFWEWYSRYVDEEGEVFDPLDLKDAAAVGDEESEVEEADRAQIEENTKAKRPESRKSDD